MDLATDRIRKAIANKEHVGIFGDYDCDGVTACAQLVRFFRRKNIETFVQLPHRIHDGYGVSIDAIKRFANNNGKLLITADTGIGAHEAIVYANELGVDVIITDHHELPQTLPPAYALLHPALAPSYPKPYPCGAGVVFLLISALEHGEWHGKETDSVLAMMGTVADLVELKGSNRLLVQQGLSNLSKLNDGPLFLLRENAQPNSHITSTDIAFRIAPRINAAGRMDDPNIALRALLDGGEDLEMLQILNTNRQDITSHMYEKMKKDVDISDPFLCIANEEYPPGIIGLLAGKLTEQEGKPSMIAHISHDMCTASLRSVPSYNLMEGLQTCSDLLTTFGGHSQAAGCTFSYDSFEELGTRLCSDISQKVPIESLAPAIDIDAEIYTREITLDLCETLEELEPFGQGNPEPRFLLRNVSLEYVRCVGTDGTHLQARIDGKKSIGFGLGNLFQETEHPMDIVCRIGIDTWNGARAPQIFVEDMRIANDAITPTCTFAHKEEVL
jgi:single-stranded-DNA-specific exonuclease